MKYTITESRLNKIILDYFEKSLTPFNGWDSTNSYKFEIEQNSGELFLFLEDGDANNESHMWYSECNNLNLSGPLPEGHCPVVTIPTTIYNSLTAYFGDEWKSIFKKWFEHKTGLPIIQVDTI